MTRPTPSGRLPGLDTVRAVALIGVVVMNFHGYLNGGAPVDPSFAERVFDPFIGPLSTRFAATFVMVAGIGVVLLTNRSRLSGDAAARSADRWRLLRRGLALGSFGYVLDWIYEGTILFYYGALFAVAAFLFTLRIRTLVAVGAGSVLAAWLLRMGELDALRNGRDTSWLFGNYRWSADPNRIRSPHGLVFDLWVNGTHPLLPWLGFFCAGMVIGRLWPHLATYRKPLIAAGLAMVVVGYVVATAIDAAIGAPGSALEQQLDALGDTSPFGRMPLYFVTNLGSALVATLGIAWLGDRFAGRPVVDVLRRAGQMSLSIYVAHVLAFELLVDGLGIVQPTGLDGALIFAASFWCYAVFAAAGWHRFVGPGPLEVVYRRFGG